jgi:hypothetical protein
MGRGVCGCARRRATLRDLERDAVGRVHRGERSDARPCAGRECDADQRTE